MSGEGPAASASATWRSLGADEAQVLDARQGAPDFSYGPQENQVVWFCGEEVIFLSSAFLTLKH